MATNYRALWDELNQRQQKYLEAVFAQDQEQEALEKWIAAREKRSRPAHEWRWVQYDPTGECPRPALQAALQIAGLVDPGTGSTFEALDNRGYITRKWDNYPTGGGVIAVLWVQMTPKGRKLIREIKGLKAPQRRPKGRLSEGQWETLRKLYQAGDKGLDYLALFWPYCLRLRDYNPPLLQEKQVGYGPPENRPKYRLFITEAGQAYYEENKASYEGEGT